VKRLEEDATLRPHAVCCQDRAPAWRRARHIATIGALRLSDEFAMRPALIALTLALSLPAPGARAAALPSSAELAAVTAEVKAAETAFARTMADRRLDQFTDFVAEDAVFVGAAPNIGRAKIVEKWAPFFKGPQAPFSWSPDTVEAAADGRTAISTGLARDPAGKVISRFTTIWRKDADGHWRAIVDQGVDVADCPVEKD
jgi:ketosteroid isomerase-like protein